jgi:hypothetical protein
MPRLRTDPAARKYTSIYLNINGLNYSRSLRHASRIRPDLEIIVKRVPTRKDNFRALALEGLKYFSGQV